MMVNNNYQIEGLDVYYTCSCDVDSKFSLNFTECSEFLSNMCVKVSAQLEWNDPIHIDKTHHRKMPDLRV